MNSNSTIFAVLLVLTSHCFFISTSLAAKSLKETMSHEALMKELIGPSKAKDDLSIYSEILAYYQANDQRRLKHSLNTLISQFPQSQFVDNALYLAGRQSMENRNYPEAIKYFQKVITHYPQSNRVVSATFAKAMTYKKMNLSLQSKAVLKEIKQKFPGSPESFRAESEMRLAR